tara:strand:- start:21 stop:416 length:396 start_codon:yes stop_codon:yes gene_type:complete
VSDDRELRIAISDFAISGILYDCAMANIVCDHVPLSGEVSLWSGGIYFATNIQCQELEDSNQAVDLDQIAYLPPGRAFYIFLGRTPASIGSQIHPGSLVNVFGEIFHANHSLKKVKNGEEIYVSLQSHKRG